MDIQQIKQLSDKYYFPVFGDRHEVNFTHGKMQYLFDENGKKYTDFLGAIACISLGHAEEGFTLALNEQITKFINVSNYFYTEIQAKCAEILCEMSNYERAFFCSSGAEANEGAIKLARKYHFDKNDPRTQIITCKNSFHGRTLATLAATGQDVFHKPYEPLMKDFDYVPFNDCVALNNMVSEKTCAVIIEPIQGEGGVVPVSGEFVKTARELCDKYDCVLIFDEVQTGVGRTGRFLAQEHFGISGDITTLAKALGNGFPVGAFIARGKVANSFNKGDHGTTFGGNILACTAAYYVLNSIRENDLIVRCQNMGDYFISELKNNLDKNVLDIRGMGFMIGVELDPCIDAKEIQKELLKLGFLICTAGKNTLRFLPCYNIGKDDIDNLIIAIKSILQNNEN